MLATIAMIPGNPEEFNLWSFAHQAHHRDILRLIYQTYTVQLDEYVLSPFDPLDPGQWVDLHQTMHLEMDAQLGIAGYDLTGLDWQDEGIVRDWFARHSDEHYRAGSLLGLG